MVAASSLFRLINASDLFTKIIVYGLFIGMILVFIYAICAYILLKKKISEVDIFFRECSKDPETLKKAENIEKIKLIHFMYLFIQKHKEHSIYLYDLLYNYSSSFIEYESKIISIMAALAASAPLVGLLGTVWGIVHAFMAMAQYGSGDLAAVAPGIAEALITTFAGLLVSIPSLLFYHLLSRLKQRYLYYVDGIIIYMLREFGNQSKET
jgi:biopolymer transport protein ExbB/TolQ